MKSLLIQCDLKKTKKIIKNNLKRNFLNKEEKISVKFDKWTENIINGILLSDGWLSKSGNDYRLAIEQKELSFVNLLFNQFKPFRIVGKEPFRRTRKRIYKNKEKEYVSWSFQTCTLPIFTEMHESWYKKDEKGKWIKSLPHNIDDLINSVSLAFWIAGDGYYDKTQNSCFICTNNFTKSEVEKLIFSLKKNLDLLSTVSITKKKQYLIWISTKERKKLQDLIEFYLPKEFWYKLGII